MMVSRHSIVTRRPHDKVNLIRFCVSPDGVVVPDLKGTLPGRGAWVELSREAVEQAIKRKIFGRALKCEVRVPPDLGEQVERLLIEAALGSLAMARRGGGVVTGASQVDAAVRAGKVAMVLHAVQAAEDGKRKIAQAIFAAKVQGLGDVQVKTIFDESQLARAFGGNHVIHAAIIKGRASAGILEKLRRLALYSERDTENLAR